MSRDPYLSMLEKVYTLPIKPGWQTYKGLDEIQAFALVKDTAGGDVINGLKISASWWQGRVDAAGPNWLGLRRIRADGSPTGERAHIEMQHVQDSRKFAVYLRPGDVRLVCPVKPVDPYASGCPGWNQKMDAATGTPLIFRGYAPYEGWYFLSPDGPGVPWNYCAEWLRPLSTRIPAQQSEPVATPGTMACSCTMTALMRDGCRCGAMASERARV